MDDHDTWSIAAAKERLDDLVQRAKSAPQLIVEDGETTAVVVSKRDWDRTWHGRDDLVAFMRASPLMGVDLDVKRVRDNPRDLDV